MATLPCVSQLMLVPANLAHAAIAGVIPRAVKYRGRLA